MPKYNYTVTDNNGIKNEGSLYAPNKNAAREKLRKTKQIIISIVQEKKIQTWFWDKPHLSTEDKMLFAKHMSTMIRVGITVTEALQILSKQTKKGKNRKMYENILEMIRSGQSLSKSLKNYDYVFSDIFINMVATGEKSGTLDKVLERLDIQLEKQYELKKKVVSAFIYPAIIMGITLIITIGIVVFIMPKITKIFESFDVVLPFITRALIGFSSFVVNNPIISISIAFATVFFVTTILKLKFLKPFWHSVMLHTPLFGRIVIYSNIASFARTMNSLLQSGVPVTEALHITARMIDNRIYKEAIMEAGEKVEQGGGLGDSLELHEKIFPPLTTRMLYIGEKTGSLEVTTEKIAELYENNVDSISRNLSVLLEPILLVFMAVLVGGIVLAIVLPIYQLPSLLQR